MRPYTRRRRSAALAVCTLVLFSLPAAAQQEVVPPAAAVSEGRADYVLGPGDLLTLRIIGVGEYKFLRVSNSGKLHLPYVGVIRVIDLTIQQLEGEVARILKEKGLVEKPSIQIDVTQRRAHTVYILGEVMMPGQLILEDGMRLLDLVTLGGGMNEFAIPVGYLYRRVPAKPDATTAPDQAHPTWADEVISIDFDKLAGDANSELNIPVQAGDVLYIPERRKLRYFVVGDVGNPGAFEFPQGNPNPKANGLALSAKPLRVSEAVARAGGPLKTAKSNKGVLVRLAADGSRTQMAVNLQDILQGRRPDIPVAPGDVIYIPGSAAKSVGGSLLRILPTVLAGAILF